MRMCAQCGLKVTDSNNPSAEIRPPADAKIFCTHACAQASFGATSQPKENGNVLKYNGFWRLRDPIAKTKVRKMWAQRNLQNSSTSLPPLSLHYPTPTPTPITPWWAAERPLTGARPATGAMSVASSVAASRSPSRLTPAPASAPLTPVVEDDFDHGKVRDIRATPPRAARITQNQRSSPNPTMNQIEQSRLRQAQAAIAARGGGTPGSMISMSVTLPPTPPKKPSSALVPSIAAIGHGRKQTLIIFSDPFKATRVFDHHKDHISDFHEARTLLDNMLKQKK
jgi:hypothetical protein